MKIILLLLKKSKFKVLAVGLLGSLVGVCNIGLLAIINNAIFNDTISRWKLAVAFGLICVASLVFRVLADAGLSMISQNLVQQLRLQLSAQILKTPLPKLEKIGTGNINALLVEDVGTIANSLAAIPPFLMNFITIICGIVYMGYLSPSRLGIFFIMLIIGVSSYKIVLDLATKQLQLVRDLNDKLHGYFQTLIGGVKELKLHYNRKTAFLSDFETLTGKLRHHSIRGNMILAGTLGWGQMLILVVIGLVLFVSPSVETGVQTAFPLVIIFLMTPIESVMNTVSFIQRAEVSIGKINQLGLSLDEYLYDNEFSVPRSDVDEAKTIEFENVEFLYQSENSDESFALGPVNHKFELGKIIFITGGNGSGKTSFIKVLAGLYVPDSGRILVNGSPVASEDIETYRQRFTCIFSDFFLFDKLFGIEAADIAAKTDYLLEDLQLDKKVKIQENTLSTTKLSQGQRKRLALLTAYLEDRPIYIFDEWAADQDVVYKKYFYQNILPALREKGKTVFVISHDDVYYDVADYIVKFDSGRIVGDSEGGHDIVRQHNGASTEIPMTQGV